MSAEDVDEIEHGHRHGDDPRRDLLTLGHTHVGCGCATGLATGTVVWLPTFFAHSIVPSRVIPSVSEGPATHPFRPPIA